MSRIIEYAGGRQVETRDIARHMRSLGAPKEIALHAQAAVEIDEELPRLSADDRSKMVEHRFQILLGESR